MNITIIGAGYVGLVTGVCLSLNARGKTTCVEIDKNRVRQINKGKPPFFEPGLEKLLRASLKKGKFAATHNLAEAIASADVVMIAVGTPPLPSGGSDLRALKAAAVSVGELLKARGKNTPLVAVRSTVPPGTTNKVVRPVLNKYCGAKNVLLAMIPEFLREGTAVEDFLSPDRVVIGADDDASARKAARFAASLKAPLVRVSVAEAELTKYASNTLLASLISFSNEIANLAEATPGADARSVMRALYPDRRLTTKRGGKAVTAGVCSYLLPGPGYGGSCLPKDLASLRSYGKQKRVPTPVLDAIEEVNNKRAAHAAKRIAKACGGLRGKRIALLGLAFKSATSDTRDSPSFALASKLKQSGAKLSAFDSYLLREPSAAANVKKTSGITLAKTPRHALNGADAAVIVTLDGEWKKLPWKTLLRAMRNPLIFDSRGALDDMSPPLPPQYYKTIGRG